MQAFLPEPQPTLSRVRLDSLMPKDSESGAVTEEALLSYLTVSLEMMQRTSSTLAICLVSLDDSPLLRFFGMDGSKEVCRSLVKHLQQESRAYDVVGGLSQRGAMNFPTFALVSPLCEEHQATALAKRVCEQMQYIHQSDDTMRLSLSIGIAASHWTTQSPKELLDYAEFARQHAERTGGGKTIRYSQLITGNI